MSFAPPPAPPPMVAIGMPPPPPAPLLVGTAQPHPPFPSMQPPPPLTLPGVVNAPPPPPPPPPLPSARPNQLLFTNVPAFLHNVRTIRDWIMSVGGTRSVLLLPPPPKTMDGRVRNESDISLSIDWKKTTSITALATMTNPDIAIRVLSAFRCMTATYLKDHEDETLKIFNVHPVPNNPDVPMPPIMMMDQDIVQSTSEAMYNSLIRCRDGDDTVAEGSQNRHNVDVDDNNRNAQKNLTTNDEVGGNDEEGIDPLESPAVLEAVRKFREHLATLQGGKATKRRQLVSDAIAKELPTMRQRMTEERAAAEAAQIAVPNIPGGLPPPPLPPPHLADMHLLPPPPLPVDTDHAPRGVSNQPAWMTQQQQQQQQGSMASNEPPLKKMKIDVTDTSLVFPHITSDKVTVLRQYISNQIQHYLGEAEETLITFVLNHITAVPTSSNTPANVAGLLPELTEVFDDDAVAFLQSIYEYSQQLNASSSS